MRLGIGDQGGSVRGRRSDGEEGFTLIELTVAISLLAVVMVGFAGAVYGGMAAWAASRQRSAFVEIANAEMETLRAVPYDSLGINTTTEPGWAAAYPSNQHGGRDYVNVTPADTAGLAPKSVSTVTTSNVQGLALPYTVRRWVTWTDVTGGSSHVFKRLEVRVEWSENRRTARSLTLTSIIYPGGIGATSTNTDPVASFTVSPGQSLAALATATFNASASTDADGDALTYSWDFGDGITLTGVSVSHAYALAGTYNVLLTVADVRGGSATTTTVMTISAPGSLPPTASFTRSPSTGTASLSVSVDAGASSNPGGGPMTYAWHWGDATANGSGVNATHTFASAGDFTITLTVTNTSGQAATATSTVHVDPLNCNIISGWFKNPSTNGTSNHISVGSNGKPHNESFTFYATSNSGCTTIDGRIPYNGSPGTFSVSLNPTGTVGGVTSWSGTASFGSSHKFSTGNFQTGEFWSPGTTGAQDKLSFTFSVD
ncbi:MAG: hexosaminidase [Actinomycetota bacterium]